MMFLHHTTPNQGETMFDLKVKYNELGFDGCHHNCGLCGKKLTSKKNKEIRVMIEGETYHSGYDKSVVTKTVQLSKRKDWDQDYMETGDYVIIGPYCAKKIPEEYKDVE
jgi:hypothetical protein